MSLIKAEKGEHSTYTLEFSVDKATFDAAVTKVFKKRAPSITVPGYRKGKAPRALIEKIYGKGAFYEDAVNEVLPDAYEAAVKEAGITPVGHPDFDILSMEDGVTLSAVVDVAPELSVSDYFGLTAERTVTEIPESAVDAEIEIVRKRNSREIEITDAPAELGHTVRIDYEGSIDGVPFEGGKGDDYSLELGSKTFIPGFEEQIVGHNIGDEFDVNVSFPEDYHASELAGKPAVFKTRLNAIMRVELPELDDDFAKDASEFDTMDEYRADIRSKLEKRAAEDAEGDVRDQVANALIDRTVGEIPASMVETELENCLRDYDNRFRSQGYDLKFYLSVMHMELDDFRAQLRPQAERRLKYRLALEKIAELEGIVATEEEIAAEIKKMADTYHMPEEQVRSLVTEQDVGKDIAVRKASEKVLEAAVITEKAAEQTEAQETPAPDAKSDDEQANAD